MLVDKQASVPSALPRGPGRLPASAARSFSGFASPASEGSVGFNDPCHFGEGRYDDRLLRVIFHFDDG